MSVVNIVFGKSKAPDKFYYKGKRISLDTAFGMYQKKFRFTFGTIGHKGGKVNFGGTDVLFREFSELMDDASDKMPEGTYLALYDKLKKLKDETNKNTDVDSDNYYERGGLWFAKDQWRIWQMRYEDLNKETKEFCARGSPPARPR